MAVIRVRTPKPTKVGHLPEIASAIKASGAVECEIHGLSATAPGDGEWCPCYRIVRKLADEDLLKSPEKFFKEAINSPGSKEVIRGHLRDSWDEAVDYMCDMLGVDPLDYKPFNPYRNIGEEIE